MKKLFFLPLLFITLSSMGQTRYNLEKMKMESLDRGVVAVRMSKDSVLVSWRYLSQDPMNAAFEVFRNGKKIARVSEGQSTCFMDYNPSSAKAKYEVVLSSKKKTKDGDIAHRGSWILPANAPEGYVNIPLSQPSGYKDVEGNPVEYIANDASMADLDGDGQMEIILKWDPSNSRDNSQSGLTNNTFVDAYKLDGRQLWRIDLGRNIRSGAHYTQFMVYDLDGDGCAEVVIKTGDGTIDGKGVVIGDANADYRVGVENKADGEYHAMAFRGENFRKDTKGRRGGFINRGPEYLTVFNGKTGAAVHTVDYVPERGDLRLWGDNYANRSDRYLACVAYLDGIHPSVVMCRGYYTRTVLAAWDFDGTKLTQRWVFDSNNEDAIYAGQGNHNLRVADVDGDGKDEVTYGSMAVDDDGTGLYSTNFGHGDALHVTSFYPLDDKLQVWDCHENKRDGSEFRDAATGQVIFQILDNSDVGRCMAADIDPENPGLEMWSSRSYGLRNVKGEVVDSFAKVPINMAVWWDGDLLREMLDHETISKYIPREHACRPLMVMYGCQFNNGTKSNPCLQGDILGDWREEVIARTKDNKNLRIYVSPVPTKYRFHTFLQDPVYRHSITTQNVAYNQPTQVGFYFGAELEGSGRLFRGWQFK
ncbi:MAG: rhamnogalacturonan lyase [Bacteroidaceae bacterium]|nr:rhamnogalacturonan lyase [Bacteroidaceae bacterium]